MNPQQLSPNTRTALQALVQLIHESKIPEEFVILWTMNGVAILTPDKRFLSITEPNIERLHIDALQAAGLLFGQPTFHDDREVSRQCFTTPAGYSSAESGFANLSEEPKDTPIEITESLKRFYKSHPNPLRICFLMMRFGSTALHERLTAAIRSAVDPYEIQVIRADEKEYHEDLYFNVLTYIYGCAFGIAVFERIELDEFNPNVALEVGLMFGLRKKLCLLKDKDIKTLPADLVEKLYKPFDPIEPEATIKGHLTTWLKDKGIIIVPTG